MDKRSGFYSKLQREVLQRLQRLIDSGQVKLTLNQVLSLKKARLCT